MYLVNFSWRMLKKKTSRCGSVHIHIHVGYVFFFYNGHEKSFVFRKKKVNIDRKITTEDTKLIIEAAGLCV